MESTFTPYFDLEKPNIGQKRDKWGEALNSNFDAIDHALIIAGQKVMMWAEPAIATFGFRDYLGSFSTVLAEDAELSVGVPITGTNGVSRLVIRLKTAVDPVGTFTVAGTSRHPSTGALTVGDTETLATDGLGYYVTSKIWVGAVTISTTNLTAELVDVLHLSWYDNNGRRFAVRRIRLRVKTAFPGPSGVSLTLKKFVKIESKLTITEHLGGLLDVSTPFLGDYILWDKALEPVLDISGRDEGIVLQGVLTGSGATSLSGLQIEMFYENRPTV